MSKTMQRWAAAVAIGTGLMLAAGPAAQAADAKNQTAVRSTQGSVTLDRYRGGGGRYYRGGGGRWVGPAIGLGIAGAVIGSGYYYGGPRYYSSYGYYGDGMSCYQLERRCDAGYDWACRRLDRDPRC